MGFAAALRHRGFAALWLAQLVSRLGDSVHEVALIWLVLEATGDPTLLGAVVAASALPMAAASLPAGGLVDRWNRRTVLLVVGVLRGLAVLAIPVLGPGPRLVPVVLGVAAVTGLLEAFAGPARGALLPSLVPHADRDAANALLELTRSVSRILYVAGGVAVALLGPFVVFYLDAASFLLAAAVTLGVPAAAGVPDRDETRDGLARRTARDVVAGLGYVRGHRYLPSVILLSLATTLAMAPLAVVLPFLVTETLGAGSTAFGALYAAIFVGVAAGAVAIGAFDRLADAYRGPVVVTGVGLVGASLIATATVPPGSPRPLLAAGAALAVFGVAFTLVNTPVRTLVQSTVPDPRRGVVFAVMATVTLPALPLGALAAGPLLAWFGPESVLLGQGVALVAVSVGLAATPIGTAGADAASVIEAPLEE